MLFKNCHAFSKNKNRNHYVFDCLGFLALLLCFSMSGKKKCIKFGITSVGDTAYLPLLTEFRNENTNGKDK